MEVPSKNKRRIFTPEQKVQLLLSVSKAESIRAGCAQVGINQTQYRNWKKQYDLGIKASLRNHRPPVDAEIKRYRFEFINRD